MPVLPYLFGFKGRIGRARMWAFYLIALGASFVIMDPPFLLARALRNTVPLTVVAAMLFYYVFCLYVYFALAVKRLHDREKSAWWLLAFSVVPSLCIFLLPTLDVISDDLDIPLGLLAAAMLPVAVLTIWGFIELFVLPGTRGPNRFGPDPLARD